MEDQAMALKDCGIAAVNLSASTPREELKVVHQDMIRPNSPLKLLYVTPEKIAKSKRFMVQLQKAYEKGLLARIAIDEVHCCSQWGHDFRPDYKVLGILKRQFSNSPILGLTATASTSVLEDVKEILNIPACEVFRASYNRANLFYEVRSKPPATEFTNLLVKMLQGEFASQSGIIYCFSRKETETLAKDLVVRGIMAAPYHAYMEPEERSITHRNWKRGHLQVVVATTAFGMGIDKPDVRFVIHHSLSKSMENYYQESGRAGRDGEEAKCILFFGFVDVFRQSTMVVMEQTGLSKLYQMVAYCISRQRCRRTLLAEHFDETWGKGVNCNRMCDTCRIQTTVKELDVTQILKATYHLLEESSSKEQRLTGLKLVDQLVKSEKRKVSSKLTKDQYWLIILHLLLEGYLKEDFHFTPYSTISYICPGPKAGHLSSRVMVPVVVQASTTKLPPKVKKVKGQTAPKPDEDVVILDDEDEESPEGGGDWKRERDLSTCEETKSMNSSHIDRQESFPLSKGVSHKSKVKGDSVGKMTLGKVKKIHKDGVPKGKLSNSGQVKNKNLARTGSKVNSNINREMSSVVSDKTQDDMEISIFEDDHVFEKGKDQLRQVEVDPRRISKMVGSKVKGSIKRKAVAEVIDLCDGGSHERKKRMKNSNATERVIQPSTGISGKKLLDNGSFGMSPHSRSSKEKRKLDSPHQSKSTSKTALLAHQNANLHNPSSNGNSKDNSVGSNLSVSGQKVIKAGECRLENGSRQVVKENYCERIQGDVQGALQISDNSEGEKSLRRNVGKGRNVESVFVKTGESAVLGGPSKETSTVAGDTSMTSSVSESDLESIYLEQLSSLEEKDSNSSNPKHLDDTLSGERSTFLSHSRHGSNEMLSPSKSGKSEDKELCKEKSRLKKGLSSPGEKSYRLPRLHCKGQTTDASKRHSSEIKPKRGDGEDYLDGKDLSSDGSELEDLTTVYLEQLSSLEQKYSGDEEGW